VTLSHNTLAEWLNFLENWHTTTIDLGLERVRAVALRLNLLDLGTRVITVAGTNGKGSTVAALESCYVSAGFRTGVYTSPHILQFNERIKINKAPVTDACLVDAFEQIFSVCNDITLSYFEFVTLAALWIFKHANLDICILEVGLGGRLDAVNIIDNDVSVITTIDYDHQAYLGNTRDLIAYEKAGIFRKNKPVVIMETNIPETLLSHAKILNTPMYAYQKAYHAIEHGNVWDFHYGDIQMNDLALSPQIPISNLATALMAIQLLQEDLPVTSAAIQMGLKNFFIVGRCHLLHQLPDIYIDVAHNTQSVARFRAFLDNKKQTKKCYAIFSALSDKPVTEMILPFIDYVDEWYIAPIFHPRALTMEQLIAAFSECTEKVPNTAHDLTQAFHNVLARINKHDIMIVYGSFFTVAEILSAHQSKFDV
jgi:dihydrofolate synthase / folylpolyglutamate synthase